MNHTELTQMLIDAGFDTGWAITNETLTVWEYDVEPPQPLTIPESLADPETENES